MESGMAVSIVRPPDDGLAAQGPVGWAVSQLQEALVARGVTVHLRGRVEEVRGEGACILAVGGHSAMAREVLSAARAGLPDAPESLALAEGEAGGRAVLLACGSDVRGLVYALTELADRVVHAQAPLDVLKVPTPAVESPTNAIRSVARLFTSDVEDKSWFHDRPFWEQYFSMLVSQRFNRFSMTLGIGYDFARNLRDTYFYFAYPFLLSVPGYDVRATGVSDAERDRNLETLRFISEAATARGLHFQLGLWTHAYEWIDSQDANHRIEGLTPETHAVYCRDAVRALLRACPAIAGVTFRVHGESGVPEQSYGFWRTVFEGVVSCGRRVEIDLHAKGMDREMLDVALDTGLPVNVSPKYWAEHMGLPYHQAAIREVEKPPKDRKSEGLMALSGGSRRFLRYGHGDLLKEDRRYGVLYRIWPGTQRILLWGDPEMAAGYGRHAHFCDCLGVELCEPLSFKGRKGSGLPGGRDGYADVSLRAEGGDYEKYLYTYRLFGRLLYNPDADAEAWRRFLRKRHGPAAGDVEAALANASRILPLVTTAHLPSAANNSYWPEVYTNMPIVNEGQRHPYGDTPAPRVFGSVSPLDPALFSRIEDFVSALAAGEPSAPYSPMDVALWLEEFARAGEEHLRKASGLAADRASPAFRRVKVDVTVLCGLGHFFAEKLRAGVWYAVHQKTGDLAALREAAVCYRKARDAWAALVRGVGEAYVRDLTFGVAEQLRGHWADRLPAIDEDVADLERLLEREEAKGTDVRGGTRLKAAALEGRGPVAPCRAEHTPPKPFLRGSPVPIRMAVAEPEGVKARVLYRHVNQAEAYVVTDMAGRGRSFAATLPGEYTDSPYPLQYLFELRDGSGKAWFWPGFDATLSNQPYFVVRQVRG